MDIKEFVKLPFNKQVHLCCMAYLRNEHELAYINKRMNPSYFKCRAYLMKQPTQDIKNVCIMLCETGQKYNLYSLVEESKKYIRSKQLQEESKKQEYLGTDEYNLDVEAFLNR